MLHQLATLVIGNKDKSSWSMRAWLALRLSGIPFQEIVIQLDMSDTQEKIRQFSPSGKVPCLIDENLVVWDSLHYEKSYPFAY